MKTFNCAVGDEDHLEVYSDSYNGLTLRMNLPSIVEDGKVAEDNLYIMLTKEDAVRLAEELLVLVTME